MEDIHMDINCKEDIAVAEYCIQRLMADDLISEDEASKVRMELLRVSSEEDTIRTRAA